MKRREVWTYKGHNVYPLGVNSWGGRWEVSCPGLPVGHLMADTADGIREAITSVHGSARRCDR
jgi:hypothetical protein